VERNLRERVAIHGGVGNDCCSGQTCIDGAVCNGLNKCIRCGGETEPCCASGACDAPTDVCLPNGCQRCGGKDQPCCAGGTCNAAKLTCDGGGHCVECGDMHIFPSLPCCAGGLCYTGVCSQENVCIRCGEGNFPDCPTDVPDAAGKVCDQVVTFGANTAATYEINMHQTQGRSRLSVNTVVAADNIVLSQDGTQILETGCIGTKNLRDGCVKDDQDREWCCTNGVCSVDFTFSGSSTKLTVDIMPNCAGTSDTLWGFYLHCPG
jgi:hypothetical protein